MAQGSILVRKLKIPVSEMTGRVSRSLLSFMSSMLVFWRRLKVPSFVPIISIFQVSPRKLEHQEAEILSFLVRVHKEMDKWIERSSSRDDPSLWKIKIKSFRSSVVLILFVKNGFEKATFLSRHTLWLLHLRRLGQLFKAMKFSKKIFCPNNQRQRTWHYYCHLWYIS